MGDTDGTTVDGTPVGGGTETLTYEELQAQQLAEQRRRLEQLKRERDAERQGRLAAEARARASERFVSRLSDHDDFTAMMNFIENWGHIPSDPHARQEEIDAFVSDVQNKYHELPKIPVDGSTARSPGCRKCDISRLPGDDDLRFEHGVR